MFLYAQPNSDYRDIALDDLSINDGRCGQETGMFICLTFFFFRGLIFPTHIFYTLCMVLVSHRARLGWLATITTRFRNILCSISPPAFPASLPFVCTFEADLCGMTQPQTGQDQTDWYRYTGRPRGTTALTGASQGDWYIYREGNRPRQQGDTAMYAHMLIHVV